MTILVGMTVWWWEISWSPTPHEELQAVNDCREMETFLFMDVFPRDEPPNWLSSAMWSVLDIYIQATLNELNGLQLYIYSYFVFHIHVTIIKKKRTLI